MVLPSLTCSQQLSVCCAVTALSFQVLIYQTSPFFCMTQAWPDIATSQSVEKASRFPTNRRSNPWKFNSEATISWMGEKSKDDLSYLTQKDCKSGTFPFCFPCTQVEVVTMQPFLTMLQEGMIIESNNKKMLNFAVNLKLF